MKKTKLIPAIFAFSSLSLITPILTSLSSCSQTKEYNVSFIVSGIKMSIPIQDIKIKSGDESVVEFNNLPDGTVIDIPFVKCNGTTLSKDKYEFKNNKIYFSRNAIQGDIVIGVEVKQAPVIFVLDEKVDGKIVINEGRPVISKLNEELVINIKQPGLIDNDFIEATAFINGEQLKIKKNNQTTGFDYWYDWDIEDRFVNIHILPTAVNRGQLKLIVGMAPIYTDSEKITDKNGNRLSPGTDYWIDAEEETHYLPVEYLPYRWTIKFREGNKDLSGKLLCKHHGEAAFSELPNDSYKIEYVTKPDISYWAIDINSHVIDGDIQFNLIYDSD